MKTIKKYNTTHIDKNKTIQNNIQQTNNIKTITLFAPFFVINIANNLAKIINECGISCNVCTRTLTNTDIKKCADTPSYFLFIFCPHLFLQNASSYDYPSNLMPLPKDKYFLYQLKKLNTNSSCYWSPNIQTLIINSKHTFEYTNENVEYYKDIKYYENKTLHILNEKISIMIPPVVEFKQEYFVEWKDKTIDVLLCCSLTKRRQEIIDRLAKYNINVLVVTNIFGEELTKKIAQSKILLNISKEYNSGFEYCRIHEGLMSRNTHIISERPFNFNADIQNNIDYKNRIHFINKITIKCTKLMKIINKELNNNDTEYICTNRINKNVKDILNVYCFYPHLFHKHVIGIRNIQSEHNFNIINITKGIISNQNLCHIHCFNLNTFEFMFGSYIKIITKVFNVIITYSNPSYTVIEKYKQFTFIQVNNYGMDIGPKFTVYNYLKNNNIKYNYIFYVHSKKSNARRELYIKPFISNIDYINNSLNNSNTNPTCYLNNLLIEGEDHTGSKQWTINKLYIENIENYLQIKTKNYIFTEGNYYILHKSIIDILFSDKLIYDTLNTENSFDYNWVRLFYKIPNPTIRTVYNLYKNNKWFGNNIAIKKDYTLADGMIEHIFERLPITLCKENKINIHILK